jgi:hypothetical protein
MHDGIGLDSLLDNGGVDDGPVQRRRQRNREEHAAWRHIPTGAHEKE